MLEDCDSPLHSSFGTNTCLPHNARSTSHPYPGSLIAIPHTPLATHLINLSILHPYRLPGLFHVLPSTLRPHYRTKTTNTRFPCRQHLHQHRDISEIRTLVSSFLFIPSTLTFFILTPPHHFFSHTLHADLFFY